MKQTEMCAFLSFKLWAHAVCHQSMGRIFVLRFNRHSPRTMMIEKHSRSSIEFQST